MARPRDHEHPIALPRNPVEGRWRGVLLGVWLAVGCVGLAAFQALSATPYVVAFGVALAMAAARRAVLARRRGERFLQGAAGIGALLASALGYFGPAAVLLVLGGNALADRSPPERHLTVVVDTSVFPLRSATVRSWRAGEDTVRIPVSRRRSAEITRDTPLIVTTRAGAFGWERVEDVEWP